MGGRAFVQPCSGGATGIQCRWMMLRAFKEAGQNAARPGGSKQIHSGERPEGIQANRRQRWRRAAGSRLIARSRRDQEGLHRGDLVGKQQILGNQSEVVFGLRRFCRDFEAMTGNGIRCARDDALVHQRLGGMHGHPECLQQLAQAPWQDQVDPEIQSTDGTKKFHFLKLVRARSGRSTGISPQ